MVPIQEAQRLPLDLADEPAASRPVVAIKIPERQSNVGKPDFLDWHIYRAEFAV